MENWGPQKKVPEDIAKIASEVLKFVDAVDIQRKESGIEKEERGE